MERTNRQRNEIGSEFWDIPVSAENGSSDIFPLQSRWFISGTAAIDFILADIQSQNIICSAALPSWCCSCMIEPFLRAGIQVYFYSVYFSEERQLVCDYTTTPACDVTLVLQYFGYSEMSVKGEPSGIIITDLTHTIFSSFPMKGDYFFGSLRKWAGFWTGGYAWPRKEWSILGPTKEADPGYLKIRQTAMQKKQRYISGASSNKDYLALFEQGEDFLDQCGIQGSCERDIKAARQLDSDYIRKKRRANAQRLLQDLRELAIFPEVGLHDCPLFVPLYLPRDQRDSLRKYLISQEIYCPVHWGISEHHKLNEKQLQIYRSEISIVCDQRYDSEDMERIVNAIRVFGYK